MDRTDLEGMWFGGGCDHADSQIDAYGLDAILSCNKCDAVLQFSLKFGRPKTFEVEVVEWGKARLVGRAPAGVVDKFLNGAANRMVLPKEGTFDDASPIRDEKMLDLLLYELGGKIPDAAPTKDFAREWRGIGCHHKTVMCRAYADKISINCTDCGSSLLFWYVNDDKFDVDMVRMPQDRWKSAKYGRHGTDAVLEIIREFVCTLELPAMMSDSMSDDPDRDARQLAAMVSVLERRGVIRRVQVLGDNDELAERLSALNIPRDEFERRAGILIPEMRRKNAEAGGRGALDPKYAVEAMWLAWPCWFDGARIAVVQYDPTGLSGFCCRCGFSTLDDDSAGQDRWQRGCPECGYPGYLLRLENNPPPTLG